MEQQAQAMCSMLAMLRATDLTYEIGGGGKHKYFKSPSPANFDAVSLYLLNSSALMDRTTTRVDLGADRSPARSHPT